MKISKTVKVLTALLLVVMMVMSLNTVAFAGGSTTTTSSGEVGSVIDKINESANNKLSEDSGVATLGGQIVGIIQIIGIVVAVVILLVLGIKYMTGSAQEKAEYKKTMIPYIIGAILIFAASTIVNVIFNLATNIQV